MGNAFSTTPITLPAANVPLEKWSVTTPPTDDPVEYSDVKSALRLDDDSEQTLIQTYIDAATDHAQDELATSLMPQTITAVFNAEDVELSPPVMDYPWDPLSPMGNALGMPSFATWGTWNRAPVVRLYRGPVQSIVSIVDATGATLEYVLERTPRGDRVRFTGTALYPVKVVYVAGYANQAAIPASIRVAIMAHVATLYANRESANAGGAKAVPHSLEDFYRLKSRRISMG